MRKGKRKTSVVAMMAVLASLLLPVLAATPAQAVDPDHVNSKIEGCKPTAGSYQTTPQVICTNNANYTTGNLGKAWNELDLVPYRITLDAGQPAPANQTYTVAIVLDAVDGNPDRPGYDVISAVTKNTALSTGGAGNCAVTSGPQTTKQPGFGGIEQSIYRLVTITQAKNTKCVFDWYGRLALGSHLFPGSSLHANLANEALTQGGSDVSIPVNEISPQELRKTMSAVQDSDVTWDITKTATPAHLDFENACDPGSPTSLTTDITITWTKNAAVGGNIFITTHVFAKNPAARPITANVTDVIKSNGVAIPGGTFSWPATVIPANTEIELTPVHTLTVPANTALPLSDTATATYVDTITNIPIPGNVVANASATVQGGNVTNDTAIITDVETISGVGFDFTVDNIVDADNTKPGGAQALNGDTLVGGTWTSGTVSASGSVTLQKTVTFDQSVGASSGSLDDTATLTAADGFVTDTGPVSVDLDSTLSGSLVINKTTTVPVDGETIFEFEVNPGGIPVTVTIPDGGTSGSSDLLTGLAGGDYTVTETNSNGFTPAADQQFSIGKGEGEVCAASLDFENTFGPASAQVFKITVPPGSEADWEFAVTKNGQPFDSGKTDATGTVQWDTALSDTLILADEGDYVVTETTQDGWDLTDIAVDDNGNGSGAKDLALATCSFTVDYPADADGVFSCTFTNTRQTGRIVVQKVTDPDPDTTDTGFGFTSDYGAPFSLKNGEQNDSGALPTGTYSVSEDVPPAGWDLVSFTCDDGSDPAAIDLGRNETVTCTATNVQRGTIIVEKQTEPDGDPQQFDFTGDAAGTIGDDDQIVVNDLVPGQYTSTETVPSGWDLTSIVCDDANSSGSGETATFNLEAGETVKCTFTNTRQVGNIIVRKMTDPAGSSQAFTFSPSYGSTFDLTDGQSNPSGPLPTGVYSVEEINIPSGWTLESQTCDDGSPVTAIDLGANETVTCTFTNKIRGSISIKKTKSGATSNDVFQFELRQGVDIKDPLNPADDVAGTLLAGPVNVSADNVSKLIKDDLVPGTYNLCEIVPGPGWDFTFDGNSGYTLVIAQSNDRVCYNVTVTEQNKDVTVAVNNIPPPGGGQLTIGFWKNHASCKTSGGNQAPVLDQVLATFPIEAGQTTHGFYVGTLYVDTCVEARNLLDKKPAGTLGKGKKAANDALINLAAQYVAAKLNIQGGAGTCPAIITAMASAKTLFEQTGFDGSAATPLTAAQKAQANSLATTIDQYNNGLLC